MKKIYYSLFTVALMFIVTSATISKKEPKPLFEKIVWLELDVLTEDSVLFKPYSKAWKEMWQMIDPYFSIDGTPIINYEKYKFSFENRKDNLFTILHPMIMDGSLQLYSPFDPSFGMGTKDDGELRYPLNGKVEGEMFVTSEAFRETGCYYLGRFGPQADIPLVNEYGEEIIKVDSITGEFSYVYPPRDYIWHKDEDIIKYKIRVSVLYNKNGIEKKRIIKSIVPIVYLIDGMTGEITGEKELFWLDFEEITPHLKKAYYFDETGKPVSYLKYIQQKVVNIDI